jgi:stearoyl-CoA desaturase (delta-9 desaturase)
MGWFYKSAVTSREKGQLDTSASIIRLFERLGWAGQVRWPDPARLATRRVS